LEIVCSGCNSRFVVPDEKIPKDRVVRIKCPKCGEKIVLEPKTSEEDQQNSASVSAPSPEKPPEVEDYGYSEDELPETYEGARLALFVGDDNELLSQISRPLEDMGYKVVPSSDLRAAVGKMRLHQFDLIILQEGFGGDIKESIVMKYINHLPMAIRRKSFVLLLSKTYRSVDQMMAFALSVNLIINVNDIAKLSEILDNAIKKQEIFYKPFIDIMKETGRL